jgi:hypothetical protein
MRADFVERSRPFSIGPDRGKGRAVLQPGINPDRSLRHKQETDQYPPFTKRRYPFIIKEFLLAPDGMGKGAKIAVSPARQEYDDWLHKKYYLERYGESTTIETYASRVDHIKTPISSCFSKMRKAAGPRSYFRISMNRSPKEKGFRP